MRTPKSRETPGSAPLNSVDPDLVQAIPAEHRTLVAPHLRVRTLEVTRGAWDPSLHRAAVLGLSITAGALFRCVDARGQTTGDLLGPGDLIDVAAEPPALPGGESADVSWTVLDRLEVAILDARFAACTARWPGVSRRLLARRAAHADRLMARFSVVHHQRIEERLLLVLWEVAERWGKVTTDGVVVPVPLRHHQLAALVGTLRPSVSLGLQRLAARGVAERCVHGYLLHGSLDEGWARIAGDDDRVAVDERVAVGL
jgi:CRP/FNR family transcriptional regulator, cyclic AMP receptor protein